MVSEYISALLLRYEPSRPLRLSGSGLLSAPRVRAKRGGAVISCYSHVEQTPRKLLQLSPLSNQD